MAAARMQGLPSDRYGQGPPTRAIYPSSRLGWYVGLLVLTKALRAVGLYLSYDVLHIVHVVQFLFLIKTIASFELILIQKPFSAEKKLTVDQWSRVVRHAFVGSTISLLWLFGLSLCGPLRTILLFEHGDLVVIAGASALVAGSSNPAKLRGALCFAVAVVSLLLFDDDNMKVAETDHPEGQQHDGVSHLFYYLMSWAGVADHKGGVVLLVLTLCLHAGFNSASRKLSVEVGGSKRLNALSTLASAVLLAPWAMFLRFTQHDVGTESPVTLFLSLVIVSSLLLVFDYYVDSICCQRIEEFRAARYTMVAMTTAALILTLVWNRPMGLLPTKGDALLDDHALSGGVIFSSIIFILATILLSTPSKLGSKGNFVGYSAAGLPLYTFTGDALQRTSQSALLGLRSGLKRILDEADSRRIFYFLCLNLAFTFVELTYGIWTNSLGLISDGFHMLFDCSALLMGMYAALMARWKATHTFSYGYARVEVLSGFINGLFLIVIALFVFIEGLGRLLDPPEIITERLLAVSVCGLIVNLVGIAAFHFGLASSHGHSHGPSSSHGHSHSNANMQGVFLHILADTLGSVGVIISSILIEKFGWLIADPICSLFIAALILLSVLPLLKQSSMVLLLMAPLGREREVAVTLQKVLAVEGVLSYRDEHFWQHSSDILAGTIHIQVRPDASEQKVIAQVSTLYRDIGFNNFTIQVEKEEYFHHLSGLSARAHGLFHSTTTMLKPGSSLGLGLVNASSAVKAI